MNEIFLIGIPIFITFVGLGVVIFFLSNKLKAMQQELTAGKENETLTEWLKNMQSTMDSRLKDVHGSMDVRLKSVSDELARTSNTLNQRVDKSSKTLNERLDKAADVIGHVKRELGSMSEIGRNMSELQNFLKAPKLRGNIGEQVLKDLLEQMIPRENYTLQHTFRNGQMVDALIKVEEGYIPIDSKFPLENFNAMVKADSDNTRERAKRDFTKDVKKHITDISKKYILPQEGTVDFALMYIPSESIYYEIVVNNEKLGKYSWEQRVLPVSPNVFYSYLKAILIGLEGKKVESRAKEILAAIRGIKTDADKYAESLQVLSKHIGNAKVKVDEASTRFENLNNRINSLNKISLTEDNAETIKEIETNTNNNE